MKIIKLPQGLTQKVGRQMLTVRKNSPKLLFVSGLVGVAVSTVMACRATLKLGDTLDEFKEDIDAVKESHREVIKNEYDPANYNRDLVYVYAKGTMNLVKLYGPTILISAASITALTGSHVTLARRNAGLTAAYSAVSASYDAYRDRVRKELGEEKELDFYHAVQKKDITVDGKTEKIRVADPNQWSPYARFFDEASPNWQKDAELNRLFVTCQQNYANHLLQARGHIFLNEVYDMLGIDRCQAGQVVGWVIGHDGDNYIDFGVFTAANAQFVNGWERSVLLDFNVDGVIYDKIG